MPAPDYPQSIIRLLLLPDEVLHSPSLASVWASEMLAAGFEGRNLVDVAVLDADEWEALSRKIGPALAEVGLSDLAGARDLTIGLMSRRLAEIGALAWLAEFTPLTWRLMEGEGWRRNIGVFVHELCDLETLIEDEFEARPPSYDPPGLENFVGEAWRKFAATGALPLGVH